MTRLGLDLLGQLPRLDDPAVLGDLLDDLVHFADRLGRGGVFLGRQLVDRGVGAEVQKERFDSLPCFQSGRR